MSRPGLPYDERARAELTRWVSDWARAGAILDARRTRELRELTEAEGARIAVELLWPMARAGAGDAGEGLLAMREALRRLGGRS